MWKNLQAKETAQAITRALGVALIISAVSGLIESLAGVGERTRLVDLTAVVIERPFWILVFGFWATFVWRRICQISWPEAIEQVLSYAPLALLIPCVNVVVAWLGFESHAPSFVNILETPVSLLTFGWLPRTLASAGLLIFLVIVALQFLFQGWRAKQSPKRLLLGVLVWFLGVTGLLLIPSLVAWVSVSREISPLNAGPNILARAWVALSQEGFWWRSILERFPGVLEGETEASVRFLQLVVAYLLGLGALMVCFLRQVTFTGRQLLAYFKPVRGLSFLGAALFGLSIGGAVGGSLLVRGVDLAAILLFSVTLFATWGVTVWRNDLHDQEADLADERPTASIEGVLGRGDVTWLGRGLFGIALSTAWLLGWPVLVSLGSFLLLQEALSVPALRWKKRPFGGLVLALSFVCVATSGVFFSLRTAAVPLISANIWLTVAVFYLFHALPKAFRWSPSLVSWFASHLRLSPRLFIPIALALGYLSVPLFSGWVILWWIAVPCAVVALLPLLGNGRWDERKIVGWQTAFILILFLLLSVYPSP